MCSLQSNTVSFVKSCDSRWRLCHLFSWSCRCVWRWSVIVSFWGRKSMQKRGNKPQHDLIIKPIYHINLFTLLLFLVVNLNVRSVKHKMLIGGGWGRHCQCKVGACNFFQWCDKPAFPFPNWSKFGKERIWRQYLILQANFTRTCK